MQATWGHNLTQTPASRQHSCLLPDRTIRNQPQRSTTPCGNRSPLCPVKTPRCGSTLTLLSQKLPWMQQQETARHHLLDRNRNTAGLPWGQVRSQGSGTRPVSLSPAVCRDNCGFLWPAQVHKPAENKAPALQVQGRECSPAMVTSKPEPVFGPVPLGQWQLCTSPHGQAQPVSNSHTGTCITTARAHRPLDSGDPREGHLLAKFRL